MINKLIGKKVLITGGDKGVGRGIVEAFVEKGADVYFTYNSDKEQADATKQMLKRDDQILEYFQLDITDLNAVKGLAKDLKKISTTGIDILVNNAGILHDGFFLTANLDKWSKVIDVNFMGTINVAKEFLMQIVSKKQGSIINVVSVSGINGIAGQTNYSASKGGIISFTKSLSKEVARFGVTVNAIAPGYVDTGMVQEYPDDVKKGFVESVPMKRFAAPIEIGYLATFLGSEESRYITGQVIVADGGLI